MDFARLRPLSFGEILDGSFSLYRRNFSAFFLAAVLPALPIVALGLVAAAVISTQSGNPAAAAVVTGLFLIVFFLIQSLVTPVLQWGALSYLVSRAYTGEPATWGEGLRRALRRFFPLLLASFFVVLMMMFGFMLLIVPGFLVACMFFGIAPAVVVEGRGPVQALGRSRELARGAWGRIFLVVTVAMIITALPSWGLEAISIISTGQPSGELLGTQPLRYVMLQVINTLIAALTAPFMVGAIVLLYYDRRVRAEALDVELAAQSLQPVG